MNTKSPKKTKITNWTPPTVRELAAEILEMALTKVVEKGLFKRVKKLPADPVKGIGFFEEGGRYYQEMPVKPKHLKDMQEDFQKLRVRIGGILQADDQMQRDRIDGLFREEGLKRSKEQGGKVIQVTPDGVLVRTYVYSTGVVGTFGGFTAGRLDQQMAPTTRHPGPAILVVGHPKQGQLADGDSIKFFGYEDGTFSYQALWPGAENTVKRWVYVSENAPPK